MCDYSLHAIASRPARVGEALVHSLSRVRDFRFCLSRGKDRRRLPSARYRIGLRNEREISGSLVQVT
jgi:hypothetical protein